MKQRGGSGRAATEKPRSRSQAATNKKKSQRPADVVSQYVEMMADSMRDALDLVTSLIEPAPYPNEIDPITGRTAEFWEAYHKYEESYGATHCNPWCHGYRCASTHELRCPNKQHLTDYERFIKAWNDKHR